MFKKNAIKKTYFKDSWLKDKEYSDQTVCVPRRNTQATCCICKVNFDLVIMGSSSLTSHGKGQSHEFKVKEARKIADFLNQVEKHL